MELGSLKNSDLGFVPDPIEYQNNPESAIARRALETEHVIGRKRKRDDLIREEASLRSEEAELANLRTVFLRSLKSIRSFHACILIILTFLILLFSGFLVFTHLTSGETDSVGSEQSQIESDGSEDDSLESIYCKIPQWALEALTILKGLCMVCLNLMSYIYIGKKGEAEGPKKMVRWVFVQWFLELMSLALIVVYVSLHKCSETQLEEMLLGGFVLVFICFDIFVGIVLLVSYFKTGRLHVRFQKCKASFFDRN